MPKFEDFLDEIKGAGIIISGNAALLSAVAGAQNWPAIVATLARTGRADGIRFRRTGWDLPSDDRLSAVLAGYPFTPTEAKSFIDNAFAVNVDEYYSLPQTQEFNAYVGQLYHYVNRMGSGV